MITPVQLPNLISLADNQVVFGFKTPDRVVSPGAQAKLTFIFSQLDYQNWHQFSIKFSDRTIVFSSAASPDDSGQMFRSAGNGDNHSTWPKKVSEDLAANYYISMLYDVSYGLNRVYLTAKSVGTAYNITGVNISVQGLTFVSTWGVDEVVNPFFQVYLQIVSVNKILGERRRAVNDDNVAMFDISSILRPEPKVSFLFPDQIGNLLVLRNEARIAFYARYGLYFTSTGSVTPEVKKLSNTAVFYALPGGVNMMTEARYNELNTSFYGQLMINHQFLTWHPISKRTQKAYMEKLWFIVHTPVTKVKLKVRLNFSKDGVNYTYVFTKETRSASIYDLWEVCCGYNRLMIDWLITQCPTPFADYDYESYDVFLTDQDDKLISEIRNFYVDDEITIFDRQFIFSNSFKLFETFAARGIKQSEPQYVRTQINQFRTFNFKNGADQRNYINLETNKQTVEIGNFISAEEKRYLSELLLSTEVYEIVNGMKYPVVITGTNKTATMDDSFLNSVTIEYIYGCTDQHYSVEEKVIQTGLIPHVVVGNQVNLVQEVGPVVIGGMVFHH